MPNLVPGTLALGAGVVLMLVAALDPRDHAFAFGRTPVAFGALAFMLAGLALLLQGLHSRYRTALQSLFGTLIVAALAAVSGFVTLGSPFLMLFSFLPCLALTGVGVWVTVRDFWSAWRDGRRDREAGAEALTSGGLRIGPFNTMLLAVGVLVAIACGVAIAWFVLGNTLD